MLISSSVTDFALNDFEDISSIAHMQHHLQSTGLTGSISEHKVDNWSGG